MPRSTVQAESDLFLCCHRCCGAVRAGTDGIECALPTPIPCAALDLGYAAIARPELRDLITLEVLEQHQRKQGLPNHDALALLLNPPEPEPMPVPDTPYVMGVDVAAPEPALEQPEEHTDA